MIPTIFSSFYFLMPIYLSKKYNDTNAVILFSSAMGISLVNHSHSFHTNSFRRLLFSKLDVYFFYIFAIYLMSAGIYERRIKLSHLFIIITINSILYGPQSHLYLENYKSYHVKMHILFHLFGISSLTFLRFYKQPEKQLTM